MENEINEKGNFYVWSFDYFLRSNGITAVLFTTTKK